MSTRIEPALQAAPPDAAAARGLVSHRTVALAALGLLALATWLLLHPYRGLYHDSVIYTLFALAKMHPDALNSDIFLRFGSQDSFTLFTPLYVTTIHLLGLEHAAALLLFIAQLGLLVCAWLLARRFVQPLEATLAVALLVLLPSEYGSGDTFHYLEDFLTPRMLAEVLTLAAVLAAVRERYWIAAGAVAAAMLLHPLMAVAGVAFLVLTFLVPRRPKLTLGLAAVGLIATLALVIAIAPAGRLEDKDWMYNVRITSGYLFLGTWSLADWCRTAVPLAVLAIGWSVGMTPLLRRLCAGALATVACGMVITAIFADRLHVSLFISLQAWRWTWLADVLALTLAPVILQSCWQRGYSGRIAAVVLVTSWVFRGLPPDLLCVAAAIAFATLPAGWGQDRYWRPVFLGACAMLGLAICLDLSDRFSYMPAADAIHPAWLQLARRACADGVIPGLVLAGAWALLRHSASRAGNLVIAVAGALACVVLIPPGWSDYSSAHYTPEFAAKFASWREQIPARAEVLWPDTPVGAWYVLERPSYWSNYQIVGAIFSKEKAIIMGRRTSSIALAPEIPDSGSHAKTGSDEPAAAELLPPQTASRLDLKGMIAVCADPDLQYIVSWMPVTHTPFAPVNVEPSRPNRRLYLYRCTDLRS
jgi:hypothetical protein